MATIVHPDFAAMVGSLRYVPAKANEFGPDAGLHTGYFLCDGEALRVLALACLAEKESEKELARQARLLAWRKRSVVRVLRNAIE